MFPGKIFGLSKRPSRLSPRVYIGLLFVLLTGSVWLRLAPARLEAALRQASLGELQARVPREEGNARLFYYLGLRYRETNHFDKAYDAFSHAADQDPHDAECWIAAAGMAEILNGDQGAFDILYGFLKNNPRSGPAHLALAKLYQKNQSRKRAYEELRLVTQLMPQDAEAWRLRGVEAHLWGQTAEVEPALRKALALQPDDWRTQINLGDALTLQKRYAEAEAFYQQAARLAPQEAQTHFALGQFLARSGAVPDRITEAHADLLRAVELSPNLTEGYLTLGHLDNQAGRWAEARRWLEKARSLAPHQPEIAFELARAYRHLGETAAAKTEAERHQKIELFLETRRVLLETLFREDRPELRLQLARLCAANADAVTARMQYRLYLSRRPQDRAVQQEYAHWQSQSSGNANRK